MSFQVELSGDEEVDDVDSEDDVEFLAEVPYSPPPPRMVSAIAQLKHSYFIISTLSEFWWNPFEDSDPNS